MNNEERDRLGKIIESLNDRLDKTEGKATIYKTLFFGLIALIVVILILKWTGR